MVEGPIKTVDKAFGSDIIKLGFIVMQMFPDIGHCSAQALLQADPGFPAKHFLGLAVVTQEFHDLTGVGAHPLILGKNFFVSTQKADDLLSQFANGYGPPRPDVEQFPDGLGALRPFDEALHGIRNKVQVANRGEQSQADNVAAQSLADNGGDDGPCRLSGSKGIER